MEEAARVRRVPGNYQRLARLGERARSAAKHYVDGIQPLRQQVRREVPDESPGRRAWSNPELRIYDNDERFATCCYDQSKALAIRGPSHGRRC